MSPSSIAKIPITRFVDKVLTYDHDLLSVEWPLEIQLIYGPSTARIQKSISITMRTPGHDLELALGFLFTEGIISNVSEVVGNKFTTTEDGDVLEIEMSEEASPVIDRLERNFYSSSSCGVCGKANLKSIRTKSSHGSDNGAFNVSTELILHLPELLRLHQSVFEQTGGLHACAIFDREGGLNQLREDVGRHNALDKLIGNAFIENLLPLSYSILILSGRVSFELMQKASMAGIPVIVAVGAPSSMAVQMAKELNITLIGFLRGNRFNVYAGAHRVICPAVSHV